MQLKEELHLEAGASGSETLAGYKHTKVFWALGSRRQALWAGQKLKGLLKSADPAEDKFR